MSRVYPPIYELHTVHKMEYTTVLRHQDDYPTLQAARQQATVRFAKKPWVIFEKVCIDTNIGKPRSE